LIPITAYAGRDVAVFGLTEGGMAAARALIAGGARVHAWDESAVARAKAEAEGLALSDVNARDWRGLSALVVSASIAVDGEKPHRIVELARAVGVTIVGDVELFAGAVAALAPHARPRIVGIAGGDGDLALAALIGHILNSGGKDARVSGVDGAGVLDLAPLHAGAIYVLALSPSRLALTQSLRCDVAIWLDGNAGETRIFDNQGAGDWAIIAVDAPGAGLLCTKFIAEGGRSVAPISARQALSRGVSALDTQIYDALDGPARTVVDLSHAPGLPGGANKLRAAGAYAAARALGLAPRTIAAGMISFPGLPHRMAPIGRINRVLFIDDSASETPDAAAKTFACYRRVRWIGGGVARDGGVAALSEHFPRIAKAYLIGEAAPSFAATLKRANVPSVTCADIADAARQAYEDAREDDEPIVLLSPACAPFDQFADSAARGAAFKLAFRALETQALTPVALAEAAEKIRQRRAP
jgi:UDP-N-acetylmuramoylalanine--D-glutamate ligase